MRYPDIEIYVKDVTFQQIEEWLNLHFKNVERKHIETKKSEARSHWLVDGSEVIAFGNAIAKYSSIWFKQNNSPWDTDLDCAHTACKQLATQIRCSNSSWEEGQGPESQWWRIVDGEEDMLIEWPEG
ncbi:MAG: hypothetical protein ACI8SR_003343 [Oceanicoccus sp.]|jgi:hypothetical protein